MDHVPYRYLLLAGMALSALTGLPHRLRSATNEKLDRTQEGWSMMLGLRLAALLAIVATVVYVAAPATMEWSRIFLPAWARYLGAGLLFGGAAFMAWTMAALGRNLTDTVVTRRDHQLVTTGPYAWMRHPFYFAYLLQWLGAALLASNAAIALLHCVVWTLLLIRARTEDAMLSNRFGQQYQQYRKRVGVFWPHRSRRSL